MELGWSTIGLIELVKQAYFGKVMLPDFQRNFVWARYNIEELVCSLLEKIFIGTFLIQRVDPKNIPFKVNPVEGADKVNHKFIQQPEIIILDGQQRLTSLFYALYSPDIPLKNTTNPYAFFIDLQELANDNIEDAIFSWSKEWREYKALLNKSGEYDLVKLKEKKILPLSFLNNNFDFFDLWYSEFKNLFDENKAKKIIDYIRNIIDYQVYALNIPITEKLEDIVILFERINRTGIELSTFDLLTAKLYKFFNLKTEWEDAFNKNHYLKKIATDVKNTKIPYYIIQGLLLSRGMSIKARDMIKIDSKVLNKKSWQRAVKILEEKILKRLFDVSEYGIAENIWLSYPSIISILLGLFIKYEEKEINIDITKINKWYWSVIFTERYSGSTETKQTKDFKDLLEWMINDDKLPESVLEIKSNIDNMKIRTKYSGSAIYKGVFNLLFKRKAWDFYEKDSIKFSSKDLEDHHIFPKKFLEDKGVKSEQDIILNKTLILSSTNKKISKKAPSTYINEMIKIHGGEKRVKEILEKHFINEEMFEILKNINEKSAPDEVKAKFGKFITLRENLIKNEIRNLIG